MPAFFAVGCSANNAMYTGISIRCTLSLGTIVSKATKTGNNAYCMEGFYSDLAAQWCFLLLILCILQKPEMRIRRFCQAIISISKRICLYNEYTNHIQLRNQERNKRFICVFFVQQQVLLLQLSLELQMSTDLVKSRRVVTLTNWPSWGFQNSRPQLAYESYSTELSDIELYPMFSGMSDSICRWVH